MMKISFSKFRVDKVQKNNFLNFICSRINTFHSIKLEMYSIVLGIHNFILIKAVEA